MFAPIFGYKRSYFPLLSRFPLEKRRFQRRCICVYKYLNGLVKHGMNFIRQREQHDYHTRTRLKLDFQVSKGLGPTLSCISYIKDFNSLSQAIKKCVNENIFQRNLFKFVIYLKKDYNNYYYYYSYYYYYYYY